MAAVGTICAGKTITEDPTLQVAPKIAFHKTRDWIFVQIPFSGQGKIGFQMFLHHTIQYRLGGVSRFINSGPLRWLPFLRRGAALSCHDDSPEANTVYIYCIGMQSPKLNGWCSKSPAHAPYKLQDTQWCLQQAKAIGPACQALIEHLFADRIMENLRAAQGVIRPQKELWHSALFESLRIRSSLAVELKLKIFYPPSIS